MQRPPVTGGMRHLALNVIKLEAAERFYVELLGMKVEWRPDPDNIYLCSGCDNLALHRATYEAHVAHGQRLDHLGFILRTPEDVDAWHAFLRTHEVPMDQPPKTHRDGARSFYCFDPDGNRVQMIYHPPVAAACG